MTGEELDKAIGTPPPPREFLIDSFLATETVMMLTGEAGQGKSVISTQIAVSLTKGTPLFGSMEIDHPYKVYYIQLEGNIWDHLARIHLMKDSIPINCNNLYWDQDKFLNVRNKELVEKKIEQIGSVWPDGPDLVVIDPIYKVVFEDLAKAENALALIRFSDMLTATFNCSILLVHHLHRPKYEKGKKLVEKNPFYGHSFLINHMGIAYEFQPADDSRIYNRLVCKKSNLGDEEKLLELCFDPESYTSSLVSKSKASSSRGSKTKAVTDFLKECALQRKSTTFNEILVDTSVSPSLRKLQCTPLVDISVEFQKRNGHPTLWIPTISGVSTKVSTK